MKMHFNLQLSAEGGKLATNELSGEIGRFECPIGIDLEFEAAEVQQMLGLCKEVLKDIPNLIEKYQIGERETASHRAKLDEHIEEVRRKLEAENIRLRADRADNAAALAHMRNIELAQLKNNQMSEQPSEPQPDEPQPDERHNRNNRK